MPTSLPDAAISFPMFGSFSINPPNQFTVFGLTLHFYGAIIAVGFLIAAIYCYRRAPEFGVTGDDLVDMLIFAVPSAIVGARLYYVVFNFSMYSDNLSSVFKIWEGGLAIYGGIIAAVIALYFVCRHKKISAPAMLDLGAHGLLIGQAVGRWANFINREAFGAQTDIFCRMGLTRLGAETLYVHPTFLYESLWNAAGLVLLHIFTKKGKRKYDGQAFILYIGWYGLGRMLIEGLRTDSLYLFGSLRVSQLLAGLSLAAALVLLWWNAKKRVHTPEQLWVNRTVAEPEAEIEPGTDN